MTMTHTASLWTAPLLKIERAEHRINDLNGKLAGFLAEKPFETVTRYDPERDEFTLRRKTNKSIPSEFSLIIGDAVHNLRCALDLTIFGLIGARAQRPEAVQFPFGKDAERFKSVFMQRQIAVAGEHVQRAIHELRPYGGGNYLLYGLHELDITDKHKLIVPVASAFGLVANDMNKFGSVFAFVEGEGNVVFAHLESDVMVIVPNVRFLGPKPIEPIEQKTDFQPPFSICFETGPNPLHVSSSCRLWPLLARKPNERSASS